MMRSKGETVGEVGGGVLSVTTDEGGAGDGERGYGRRVWWWWWRIVENVIDVDVDGGWGRAATVGGEKEEVDGLEKREYI